MAAQAPEASPPPTTPMDPISAIQVQLQAMVKAAGDCLEASTQHNAAASDVIDMKVRLARGDELWVVGLVTPAMLWHRWRRWQILSLECTSTLTGWRTCFPTVTFPSSTFCSHGCGKDRPRAWLTQVPQGSLRHLAPAGRRKYRGC